MPLCLPCLSSVSEYGCALPPVGPNFCVREPFSSPCYAQKFPLLSIALGDARPVAPSTLASDSSCKHASASPNVNTRGGSAYPFSVAGEAAQFSEVGEHIEGTPLHPASCAYIFLPLLSFYQCVGHICSDLDV